MNIKGIKEIKEMKGIINKITERYIIPQDILNKIPYVDQSVLSRLGKEGKKIQDMLNIVDSNTVINKKVLVDISLQAQELRNTINSAIASFEKQIKKYVKNHKGGRTSWKKVL